MQCLAWKGLTHFFHEYGSLLMSAPQKVRRGQKGGLQRALAWLEALEGRGGVGISGAARRLDRAIRLLGAPSLIVAAQRPCPQTV